VGHYGRYATTRGREGLLKQELRAGVQRCSANGWAWIHTNLALFAPADPLACEELQKLSELAMLYSWTISWSGERVRAALKPIEEFLLSFLANPAVAQYARKRLERFNPYFIAYLALRPLGYRLDTYEEGLSAARRAGYPGALEATPYRELEIVFLTWKAGLRRQRPLCNGVYCGTVLARCRNPIHLDTAAVYSVTHTLFYLNDFCGPPQVMSSAQRRRAAELVESLLVHYWRKQDWDVVGELALNLVSLDRCDTPLFYHGVGALLKAWESQPDGALPSRTFESSKAESEPDYRFKHCYHTTLVGTLFCEAYRHRADAG
jgi:Domain of unknown function (DUF6895)